MKLTLFPFPPPPPWFPPKPSSILNQAGPAQDPVRPRTRLLTQLGPWTAGKGDKGGRGDPDYGGGGRGDPDYGGGDRGRDRRLEPKN